MGQYFKPVFISENVFGIKINASFLAHDFKNGLKLMEHSYIGNDFVDAVQSYMVPGADLYKKMLVWSGDYSDGRLYQASDEFEHYDIKEKNPNVNFDIDEKYPYIVNHSKELFVDKRKSPAGAFGWQIHPLPLLTAEGNGNGGGDFYGNDPNNIVGSWARDIISIEEEIPVGYSELIFDLIEE